MNSSITFKELQAPVTADASGQSTVPFAVTPRPPLSSYATKKLIDTAEVLSRLGVNAVLLPIKEGTKRPWRPAWQETTFDQTQTATYQSALSKAPAIGVLLGPASEGLCSIDLDSDEALEEFLAANPSLQTTLRTKGRRGANLWVIIEGDIPPSRKLTSNGSPVGEWRSKGNQTVIAGWHPDGCEYHRIVDSTPVRINFGDLRWPWPLHRGPYPGALSPPLRTKRYEQGMQVPLLPAARRNNL